MIRKYGHIIMVAMAVLMSTACSSGSEDTGQGGGVPVADTRTAISFSGSESQEEAVNNGANRAYGPYRRAAGTPLSDSEVYRFNVWGYKNMSYEADAYGGTQIVFPGYQVDWHDGTASTTTTNSSGWEYILPEKSDQTIKYWDWSAKAYRYFAVTGWSGAEPPTPPATYEANKSYGVYKSSETGKPYEISMLSDASPGADAEATAAKRNATPYFSRLWFSTGDPVAYPDKQFGKPVTLEFVKPYTRVRFQFKYSYPREGIKLTEKSFKPSDDSKHIARKGIVTVHYPTEGTAIKEWFTVTPLTGDGSGELEELTEDYDPEDDGKVYTQTDEGWYMVIPNNAQGTYTLSVKVNGQARTAVVPAEYMQWLPGYSYTYIFKITEEGGVEIGWVEYAVVPWIEMFANKTVYNW